MTFLKRLFASRRILQPEDWPQQSTHSQLTKICKRFLASEGWKILDPWDWIGVSVRAHKGMTILNLVPMPERHFSWETIIKDNREKSNSTGQIVGTISLERVPPEIFEMAMTSGTYVFSPEDLYSATERLQILKQRQIDRAKIFDVSP